METVIDHAALRAEIDQARAEEGAAWTALQDASGDDWPERLADWRVAEARHAAYIKAGLLVTLGNGETPQ